MNGVEKGFTAVRMLKEQGHHIEVCIRFDKMWCEIDQRMLASLQEMEGIFDGIYSLTELEELLNRQRLDESSGS
jgi:hypothetical protein